MIRLNAVSSSIALSLIVWAVLVWFAADGWAASVVWNFDQSDLTFAYATDGAAATMTYFDCEPSLPETIEQATTFGITGGGGGAPTNMADGVAHYLHHGSLPNHGHCGYAIDHSGFLASTADGYMQTWTMVFDVYVPQAGSASYNAMFSSNAELADGAEWFLRPGGFLGHSDLGITPASAFAYDQWHRVGVVYDRPNALVEYWVDGDKVFEGSDVSDDRYLLWASQHAGVDLLFQGDNADDSPPNNYTSDVYVSSLAISDFAYGDTAMQSLGGPSASGIPLVDSPGSLGTLEPFTLPSQLDLEGNIRYAINIGGTSALPISDVLFLAGQSEITGFENGLSNNYDGTPPNFGDGQDINCLEDVLETVAWHQATEGDLEAEITLAATRGKAYKLQLLFWKAVGARWFDVSIEGQLVLDEFNPVLEEEAALVYTYEFVAGEEDDFITILFAAGGSDKPVRHPILNALTLEEIRATWIPGDVDGDNMVNEADMAVLADHWEQSGMEWEDGDFNDDGWVDATDAAILAANWGDHREAGEQGESLVPEPLGLFVLIEALPLLIARRRRRRVG